MRFIPGIPVSRVWPVSSWGSESDTCFQQQDLAFGPRITEQTRSTSANVATQTGITEDYHTGDPRFTWTRVSRRIRRQPSAWARQIQPVGPTRGTSTPASHRSLAAVRAPSLRDIVLAMQLGRLARMSKDQTSRPRQDKIRCVVDGKLRTTQSAIILRRRGFSRTPLPAVAHLTCRCHASTTNCCNSSIYLFARRRVRLERLLSLRGPDRACPFSLVASELVGYPE